MKRAINLATASAALFATLGLTAVSFAGPLKVRTHGGKSQQVMMCPDCNAKLACAAVGEYHLGLDVNVDSPKTSGAVVAVHVMDKDKKPVRDAKVTLDLSMPGHGHRSRETLKLRHTGDGRYEAATAIVMPGAYQADVRATLAGADTVKQSFSFSR